MLTIDEKNKLRDLAKKQIGKKYIFGAEVKPSDKDPKAFDCSELVEWLYYQIGYKFIDGAANQHARCQEVYPENPATGDLVFASRGALAVGHVAIITGKEGKEWSIVEARNSKVGVVKTYLSEFKNRSTFVGVGRPKLSSVNKI